MIPEGGGARGGEDLGGKPGPRTRAAPEAPPDAVNSGLPPRGWPYPLSPSDGGTITSLLYHAAELVGLEGRERSWRGSKRGRSQVSGSPGSQGPTAPLLRPCATPRSAFSKSHNCHGVNSTLLRAGVPLFLGPRGQVTSMQVTPGLSRARQAQIPGFFLLGAPDSDRRVLAVGRLLPAATSKGQTGSQPVEGGRGYRGVRGVRPSVKGCRPSGSDFRYFVSVQSGRGDGVLQEILKILETNAVGRTRKMPGGVVLAHMQRREHRTNMRV